MTTMPIRFKVTDQDYDYIDRALIDAGLSVEADIRVREMLSERGLPAAIGLMSSEKVAKKLKAAQAVDVIDQALDRGRLTATEAAKLGPDTAIAKEIDQFFAALAQKYGVAGSTGGGTTLTDSGDQSKPTTKTAQPTLKDIISNALDHVAREGIH